MMRQQRFTTSFNVDFNGNKNEICIWFVLKAQRRNFAVMATEEGWNAVSKKQANKKK